MGMRQSSVPRVEELIREHLPLVHHVAASFRNRLPAHVSVDELRSAALMGLYGAASNFDPDKGVPFAAYATTRMRGAVLDELRTVDWAPRSLRAKSRSLQDAMDRNGGTVELAARDAGLSLEQAERVIADVRRAAVVSLDPIVEAEQSVGVLPINESNPEAALIDQELRAYLHDAIAVLPERLRHVVTATFFADRPMAEVASELGVTESRVSHMRAEAVSLLREAMSRAFDDDRQELPKGVAARRRADYCDAVAARSASRSVRGMVAPVLDAVA